VYKENAVKTRTQAIYLLHRLLRYRFLLKANKRIALSYTSLPIAADVHAMYGPKLVEQIP
jgi:hypothetical protein